MPKSVEPAQADDARQRGGVMFGSSTTKRSGLTVLAVLTVALILIGSSSAQSVTVCSSGCDFTSIQAAVDSGADLIEVGPETFHENVLIYLPGPAGPEPSVSIVGSGADATIVDGGGSGLPVFDVDRSAAALHHMTIQNSSFTGVNSWGFWGDIYGEPNDPAATHIEDCVIRNNHVGVWNSGVSGITITNTTISGNQTTGFLNHACCSVYTYSVVSNSTISGNGGYGISDMSQGFYSYLEIVNSTVSGNLAGGAGSAAWSEVLTMTNSTITENFGPGLVGGFVVRGSIVANNLSDNCWDFSGGHNVSSDDCATALPSDIVNTDPLLPPLADNGGPTQTHALLPGSVAIDAAGDCGLDTDQRGFPRDDGACDSGSFEFQGGGDDGGGDVPASSPLGLLVLPAILMTISWAILTSKRRARRPT